jgi:hypothetical protein
MMDETQGSTTAQIMNQWRNVNNENDLHEGDDAGDDHDRTTTTSKQSSNDATNQTSNKSRSKNNE